MAETNAIKWLRARNVDFQVHEYEFTEIGAESSAQAINRPLEMVCKTLIVQAARRQFYAAIVPGDQRFDPRLMAAAVSEKYAELAEREDAEKISGYKIGGISPFAMRRQLTVLIEESLLALDRLVVNAGRRGILLELAAQDLVSLLDARTANICT
jgi:Cys-tRNA(Pro)/Cys-tRNA(Cys) deacylase